MDLRFCEKSSPAYDGVSMSDVRLSFRFSPNFLGHQHGMCALPGQFVTAVEGGDGGMTLAFHCGPDAVDSLSLATAGQSHGRRELALHD